MSGEKKNKNKGFSLIELIIAIAILVILTGLLAPQFMKYIEKSRLAKDLQSLDAVYTAVQGAIADENAYTALVKEDGVYQTGDAIGNGMLLTAITGNKGSDDFATEVCTILGKDDISFNSKAAVSYVVYVKVDDKMQVGVWCGTTEGCAFDEGLDQDLKVGVGTPDRIGKSKK